VPKSIQKKSSSKKSAGKQKSSKPAGKAAPAGGTKKGGKKTGRDELMIQLSKLAKELNGEGLAFLVKQALVLRHNMQVDEIRDSLSKTSAAKGKGKKPSKARAARKGADKYSIDLVEGENSRNFILVVNNSRNFFSLDEMRTIVALCHAASDVKDGSLRLYTWFKRERMDVINNTEIDGPGDAALATMYNAIISKYVVRK